MFFVLFCDVPSSTSCCTHFKQIHLLSMGSSTDALFVCFEGIIMMIVMCAKLNISRKSTNTLLSKTP